MATQQSVERQVRGLHCGGVLLPEGWAQNVRIEMAGGRIARIERETAALPGDERIRIAIPGMPNVHSHALQRGMAGLTERRGPAGDSFWSWREVMYRFVSRLTPEDLEAIAAQAYVEMLECGFTRVGEFHYLHRDVDARPYANPAENGVRIAAAAHSTAIGLTLLPVFYAHGGFGGLPPAAAQARFVNDVDGYARLIEASRLAVATLGDAVVGIAPHSLRAVTPEELSAITAGPDAGPIHIHIAEQIREVEDCKAWSGARPVEWLLDAAPVDRSWCLVHATHMTENETQHLARSGAVAGLCPITEANLGDGVFPAAAFLAAGGQFGVGSDSNVRIDLGEELRLLEYGQRLTMHARNVLAAPSCSSGRALFEGALSGGARALGIQCGLVVGAPADVVSLESDHPAVVGRSGDELLDAFIFAGGSGLISEVWRAGEKVVAEGVHRRRVPIARRYCTVLAKLLSA